MRRFLLPILIILLPFGCVAQGQFWDRLALDYVDDATHDIVKSSYWQVFERGNFHRTLNTFYRITSINGQFYLDLKIIQGGEIFVIPRNGEFDLLLEDGCLVKLYSTQYRTTSKGDGSRRWAGSGAEGMIVSYSLPREDAKAILHSYVARIRLYTGDGFVERRITPTHSELFKDEVALIYYSE